MEEIERAYHSIAPYFDLWVRIVEIGTRKQEALEHASARPQKVLIVSPPTDAGIPLLAEANSGGSTTLVCFSERLRIIAEAYQRARRIHTGFVVMPHFARGFADATFATIYVNCFFDFCPDKGVGPIARELRRILKPGGKLYAVYMDVPSNVVGHFWAWLFATFKTLSGGCHPVSMRKALLDVGFAIETDNHQERAGFPMRYTVARG